MPAEIRVEVLELPFPVEPAACRLERSPLGTLAARHAPVLPALRRRHGARARPLPLRFVRVARFLLRLGA
jgi:hypothetical protein